MTTEPQTDEVVEEVGTMPTLTKNARRLLEAGQRIHHEPPDRADFLHSVMCQVGLPRSRTEARTFERQNGHISILLEAGKLYNGKTWIDQPLPYGTTPRLVMVHVSSEAIRTQSRSIAVGDSMRQFLTSLGMQTNGGERGGYTMFKRQMEALAACRLTLGMHDEGRVVTVDAKPFKRFEAWLQQDGAQHTLWPGVLELSKDFYDTLAEGGKDVRLEIHTTKTKIVALVSEKPSTLLNRVRITTTQATRHIRDGEATHRVASIHCRATYKNEGIGMVPIDRGCLARSCVDLFNLRATDR